PLGNPWGVEPSVKRWLTIEYQTAGKVEFLKLRPDKSEYHRMLATAAATTMQNVLGVPHGYADGRMAVEQGNADAQFNLGWMYNEGKDYAEALKWWRLAAEQGHARAKRGIGLAYYEGKGVPKDYAEAARWLRKAAEQGEPLAQSTLGEMYRKGKGVPQDYVLAYMWLSLSARDLHALDSVSKKLTPQKRTEAWKLGTEVAIAAGMETLRFSPGENWVVGNSRTLFRTEMVPKGETVKNWTEMITLGKSLSSSGDDLDRIAKARAEQSKKGCTRGHQFEEKERGEIGGLPMFIVVVRCDSAAKRPGEDKSVQGKPETYVSLTIHGGEHGYTIQKAARRFDLSEATIREWIDFLKTAQVCNSQNQLSSCR
ncbi:MAG: sel1 repeat family protein, partial [Acidobacteria bacterium]|nr:sel1 repeat family protein [Acidobacteriota bacterium]